MSGAAFILIINLLVAGLFCCVFVTIAVYDRRQLSARWFAATFALGMAYFLIEGLVPLLEEARLAVFLGQVTFLGTLVTLNVGVSRRYSSETPWALLGVVFAISVAISALTHEMPRQSLLRMFLYQAPFFAMQAIGAGIVLRAKGRGLIDNVLASLFVISALHYLSKPLIAAAVGGPGENPQAYLGTIYALYSQSMGTVLAIATALLLMAMLIAGIVSEITAKSETDALSGLLNRRGFEIRLGEITDGRSVGMPVALAICDLDHFKAVNDTYGHAVGDRVISAFATVLRKVSANHHVLGRIGGEEFAIVLPGSNLATGRLFAETVRTGFANLALDGLNIERRFTASFGVAQLTPGETSASFMARADAALYEAKRAGRDCVRVSRVEQIIDDGRSSVR